MRIRLTLGYPPATNNIYRTLVLPGQKMPVRVKTGEARKYHKAVERACRAAGIKPLLGNVEVVMDVYRPRRVGDLDGTFKIVFDALKGWAFNDDKQIISIHAQRFDDKNDPRVEIEIRALELC